MTEPRTPNPELDMEAALALLDEQGLRRHLSAADEAGPTRLVLDGKAYLNFASNDYLGLAQHPELREAAKAAIDRFGVGSGASRLVTGSHRLHAELEAKIAGWKRVPRALAFSSGYAAALGTIPALAGPRDLVILDKLAHACLLDGARLSGAGMRVFPHQNLGRLEALLKSNANAGDGRRVLIVTESVFSMDGDRADLKALVDLKDRYGAWLLVDEAHAVGLIGSAGEGLISLLGLQDRVELQMGTLSKALGVSGGYLAGSATLIDYLVNRARSFIYSTAPPPALAAAALAAIRLVEAAEGARLRRRLWANVNQLCAALENWAPPEPASAIVPVKLGSEKDALAASSALRHAGIWIPAIRYPTVARGTARLRVTVSAAHSPEMIAELGRVLPTILPSPGGAPSAVPA
ncbi:MAG: 8-amino-7-oxononanoate synthase [Verrucomicrobia bacterium]|nr:8-amino-7-oxononanoate synthase [Verrucomicrobiota bacterium]